MTDPITPDTWEPPQEMRAIFHQVADAISTLVSPGQTVDDVSPRLLEAVQQWAWPHAWVLLQTYGWQICHGVPVPCAVAHPWLQEQVERSEAVASSPAEG